jgi:aerobic C4-dicarboxylate transport protein
LESARPDLLDGVGLIVGIDRMMSEARAVTNFTGNAVATVLVGKWTGEFDKDHADRVLAGELPFDEVAFADGDEHGGGAWDEELAELETEVTPARPEPSAVGH